MRKIEFLGLHSSCLQRTSSPSAAWSICTVFTHKRVNVFRQGNTHSPTFNTYSTVHILSSQENTGSAIKICPSESTSLSGSPWHRWWLVTSELTKNITQSYWCGTNTRIWIQVSKNLSHPLQNCLLFSLGRLLAFLLWQKDKTKRTETAGPSTWAGKKELRTRKEIIDFHPTSTDQFWK